eukprot:2096459-Pleurochrysis_carterae.AAC.1
MSSRVSTCAKASVSTSLGRRMVRSVGAPPSNRPFPSQLPRATGVGWRGVRHCPAQRRGGGEAAIALPISRLGPRPGAGRPPRSRPRRRAL